MSLTGLMQIQLIEVTVTKLIWLKFVSLKSGINSSDIRGTDFNVDKENDILMWGIHFFKYGDNFVCKSPCFMLFLYHEVT